VGLNNEWLELELFYIFGWVEIEFGGGVERE